MASRSEIRSGVKSSMVMSASSCSSIRSQVLAAERREALISQPGPEQLQELLLEWVHKQRPGEPAGGVGLFSDPGGDGPRAVEDLVLRKHLGHQTEPQGLLGVDQGALVHEGTGPVDAQQHGEDDVAAVARDNVLQLEMRRVLK